MCVVTCLILKTTTSVQSLGPRREQFIASVQNLKWFSLFLLFLLSWETFDRACCEDVTQQCLITAGEKKGLSLCRELFCVNRVEFDGI